MVSTSYRPRTTREWNAVLGLDNQQFILLCQLFEQTYRQVRGRSLDQTLRDNPQGDKFRFKSYEDMLFYLLFILKTGVTFDQAAFIFQFDLANAKRNFNSFLNLLYQTLATCEKLPVRGFESVLDFDSYFDVDLALIIDGTEQRVQRPKDKVEQKSKYSGKKKTHTRKCLIISTEDTYVHFVSQVYNGREHDFTILKEEFPAAEGYFSNRVVRLDLGYIGFYKEYPEALAYLPHKRLPKQQLSEIQKYINTEQSRERIKVEHSIGGIKRYEIIAGQSRLHDEKIYDQCLAVCAGLWNFNVSTKIDV